MRRAHGSCFTVGIRKRIRCGWRKNVILRETESWLKDEHVFVINSLVTGIEIAVY